MSLKLQEFQHLVNSLFGSIGKQYATVTVLSTDMPVARSLGFNLDPLPVITGTIYVHEKSLRYFTRPEVEFILAHELSHIMRNHIVSRLSWTILEQAAKGTKQEHKTIVEIIKAALALISPDHLSPNARDLRDSEYEADKDAVKITGDIQSAISCLRRLSGNGNLNNPSHTWELFDIDIPAMTLRERIAALRISANYI